MLTPRFLASLAQLEKRQQMLFCLSILQRMSPNYVLFCEASDEFEAAPFEKLLGLFWESLMYPKNKLNAAAQQLRFEELIPDAEKFDMYGVYPAIDCCVVADSLFSCWLEFNGEQAEQASQTSMAGVLGLLELQFPEHSEEAMLEHELVLEEFAFQASLLEYIVELKDSPEGLAALRRFAVNDGVSNLGICLS